MTQAEALNILKTGRNVFLTGAAGSGKTYVLNRYIEYLKDLNAKVGITASTGIAATHMGGITIHSWSGIGVRDSLSKSDVQEIAEKKYVQKKIKDASVLIIDEISMLHHFRLDFIDQVIRVIKGTDEPFGAMQVVFCGDFFQLPPVRRNGEPEAFFAYHSEIWKNLNLKVCYLSEQHRQNDAEFLKILNAIREATVNKEITALLTTRFNKETKNESTKLYSHNRNVDAENEAELEKINNRTYNYEMKERGSKSLLTLLKKSCLAPETLKLKEGAKVMFIKNNFDEGYVNGTLGTVEDCSYEHIRVKTLTGKNINVERQTWIIEEDGHIKAEINQYPLRLAWAITVHKSQGMSLDSALVDLSHSFERGMGYVALSRVRSLSGLFLKGLNEMALRVNEEVLDFDKKFREKSKTDSFHIRTMGTKNIELMHKEFAEKVRGEKAKPKKLDTMTETKKMLDEGLSIKEISKIRGLKASTILDHIEKIKEKDPAYNIYNLQNAISKNKFREIYKIFKQVGMSEGVYHLAPAKLRLGSKYSYDDLRLVRLFL